MKLRDFKRRTLGWSNDIELTIGFNGKIYDVAEFCGYNDQNKSGCSVKREIICFLVEPGEDGQD